MTRIFAPAAAAALVLALAPAANAQSPRGYYSATPVAAPAKAKLVTRSTIWKCSAGTCTAAKSTTRDAIMCELVAREVGALSGFTANGRTFDDAALEKCNAKAN